MLKLLLVVAVFAAVTYFVTRLLQERGPASQRPQRKPRIRREPPRQIAPDDDEDFLRDLDRKRLDPPDES